MHSRYFFVMALMCATLVSCGSKELMPGEADYNLHVEAAEAIMAGIGSGQPSAQHCSDLKDMFDEGVKAFEQMMPSLNALSVRKYDTRLGNIREFVEDNC